MSKNNVPKGVRQEFEDVDYWHKLDNKKKTYKLKDGTMLTEYEFMKKFMQESYGNGFDRQNSKSNILQTKSQKQWAVRNNNNTNRDALLVSRKMGAVSSLYHIINRESEQAEEWQEQFKTASYEDSLKSVMEQSLEELDMAYSIINVRALFKIYFRINKFIRLVKRDKRNNNE